MKLDITKDWFERRAALEGDHEIGAGPTGQAGAKETVQTTKQSDAGRGDNLAEGAELPSGKGK